MGPWGPGCLGVMGLGYPKETNPESTQIQCGPRTKGSPGATVGSQLLPLSQSTGLFLAILSCRWKLLPFPASQKPAPTTNIIAHHHLHAHQEDCSKAGVVSDRGLVFSKLLTSPLLKDYYQLCLLPVSLQDALLAPVPLDAW